jgi:hypothetical protein
VTVRRGGPPAILLALILACFAVISCSTGDPDTAPADAGRIGRTTAKVDSTLNEAREHIRTLDTLGASAE